MAVLQKTGEDRRWHVCPRCVELRLPRVAPRATFPTGLPAGDFPHPQEGGVSPTRSDTGVNGRGPFREMNAA